MTGVVDSSFNSKVEQHATTEMQATAADLNKRFDSLQGEVDLLSKARMLIRFVSTNSAVRMRPCRSS
jgi:Holliday junction resolvase-like predicted endonuclease